MPGGIPAPATGYIGTAPYCIPGCAAPIYCCSAGCPDRKGAAAGLKAIAGGGGGGGCSPLSSPGCM